MRIENIMSSDVITIEPDATIGQANDLMHAHHIHHLIVMEKKRVLGVLSDCDLATMATDRAVKTVMTRDVHPIATDATIRQAASMMNGSSVSCLPVVKEGSLCGIVTATDLVRAVAKGSVHLSPPSERYILKRRAPR